MLTFPVLPHGGNEGAADCQLMPGQVSVGDLSSPPETPRPAPVVDTSTRVEAVSDQAEYVAFEVCTMVQRHHDQFMERLSSWIENQETRLDDLLHLQKMRMGRPPPDNVQRRTPSEMRSAKPSIVRICPEAPDQEPESLANFATLQDEETHPSVRHGTSGILTSRRDSDESCLSKDNQLVRATSTKPGRKTASVVLRHSVNSIKSFTQEVVSYATMTKSQRSLSRLMALDEDGGGRKRSTKKKSASGVKRSVLFGGEHQEDVIEDSSDDELYSDEGDDKVAGHVSTKGRNKNLKSVRFSVQSGILSMLSAEEVVNREYQEYVERRGANLGRIRQLVKSTSFEVFFGLMIASNSAFMGIEVNYMAANPFADTPTAHYVVGYLYTVVFAFELFLRVLVDGWKFCCAESSIVLWNMLDVTIVMASVVEALMDMVQLMTVGSMGQDKGGGGGVDMSKLRVVRIVRVARLMRLFRIGRIVRFIRALRTLVYSIVSTLKSVVWSMMLLFIIVYTFAILFTQAVCDYMVALKLGMSEPMGPVDSTALVYHWGTLEDSMLTLFMSISGGVDWHAVAKPLRLMNVVWLVFFLIFISFTYFAVLNVVTSIFCQCAIESASHDQEAMIQAFISYKQLYIQRFKKLFHHMDDDDSGFITKDEFLKHIADTNVHAFFATLGIDSSDAVTLFKLIGTDSMNRGIDIEDFVMGCLRLKGAAKSCDIARLMYENKMVQHELSDLVQYMDANFTKLLGESKVSADRFFRSSAILYGPRKVPRDSLG